MHGGSQLLSMVTRTLSTLRPQTQWLPAWCIVRSTFPDVIFVLLINVTTWILLIFLTRIIIYQLLLVLCQMIINHWQITKLRWYLYARKLISLYQRSCLQERGKQHGTKLQEFSYLLDSTTNPADPKAVKWSLGIPLHSKGPSTDDLTAFGCPKFVVELNT